MKKIPTLIILYNRPDKTKRLIDELRKIKPEKLFVFCDGPKNTEDYSLVLNTRLQIEHIDWKCSVITNYANANLGCKVGVSSAITWFFSKVESGIILEDDCLPHSSFFSFASELLQLYKDDMRVSLISATNLGVALPDTSSYVFSRYSNIWGWASWRNRWESFEKLSKAGSSCIGNPQTFLSLLAMGIPKSFILNTRKSLSNNLDTWDFIWSMANILEHRLSIVPTVNMVTNIGFGKESTHTKTKTSLANLKRVSMPKKLIHPSIMIPNAQYDEQNRLHHSKIHMIRQVINASINEYVSRITRYVKKNT